LRFHKKSIFLLFLPENIRKTYNTTDQSGKTEKKSESFPALFVYIFIEQII